MLEIMSVTIWARCFFNPSVSQQMSQLGTNKPAQLAKGDEKAQLDDCKREYPSILNAFQDQAGDQECEKIRIDCFTDYISRLRGSKSWI